jgi:hypothetical protein
MVLGNIEADDLAVGIKNALLSAGPPGATSDRHPIGAGEPFRPAAPRSRSAERLRRSARVGGERQADQRRKRVRAGLLHDGGTMVLDRALADAEIGGNVLAGMAGEHQLHDLALARGQTG